MPKLHRDRDAHRLDDLVSWRQQFLARAGVDGELAAVAGADLRWDLHALLQLLDQGCPVQLAVRILDPGDDERHSR